jgi:hypothetical protein
VLETTLGEGREEFHFLLIHRRPPLPESREKPCIIGREDLA